MFDSCCWLRIRKYEELYIYHVKLTNKMKKSRIRQMVHLRSGPSLSRPGVPISVRTRKTETKSELLYKNIRTGLMSLVLQSLVMIRTERKSKLRSKYIRNQLNMLIFYIYIYIFKVVQIFKGIQNILQFVLFVILNIILVNLDSLTNFNQICE